MIKRKTTFHIIVCFVAILSIAVGCGNPKKEYSFFVAGHVYGAPGPDDMKIHPPFKDAFPFIKEQEGMAFGILAGDVVYSPSHETFEKLESDMTLLDLPYYVVPGNHDAEDRELFGSFFGDRERKNKTFRSFMYENDLFILLDGTYDDENISGEQLEFLTSTINKNAALSTNIFVFVHQLIWWNKNNEFKNIKTNWPPDVPDSNNYWVEVEPLLAHTKKPVYIFAGDLGAHNKATPYMYHKKNNISYVAGGMGNLKNDNFLIVRIGKEGKVALDIIALQGEQNRFGKLEDYQLP